MNNIKQFFYISCSLFFMGSLNIAISYADDNQIPFSECNGYSKTEVLINAPLVDVFNKQHEFVPSQNSSHISVVLVSTSWCCHCPYVIDKLMALSTNIGDHQGKIKFFFVLLGNEEDEDVKKHFKVSKNSVICKSISPFNVKNIDAVPCCIVFDHTGKQVFRYDGKIDYSCDKFKKYLGELIKNIDKDAKEKSRCTKNKKKCKICRVDLVSDNECSQKNACRNSGKFRIKGVSRKRK